MANRVEAIFISRRRNLYKNFQLPVVLIYLIAGFLAMATFSTIVLFINSTRRTFVRMHLTRMENENKALTSMLDSLSASLMRASEYFDGHIVQDNRERTYLQLAHIHPDIWSMGIGGTKTEPLPDVVDRNTQRVIGDINESMDVLRGKSYLRQASLRELQSQIDDNLYLWAHVPSTHPLPGRAICSGFGYRVDPIQKDVRLHTGVDIGAPRGSKIFATADGVVSSAGWVSGYGLTVIIDHGFGFATAYAHCQQALVKRGDLVKRGQAIAKVGSSGRSISPHVHYEVRVSGIKINPAKYISSSNVIFD